MTEGRPAVSRTAEWDAGEYHRLANPHVGWGQRLLDHLPLNGGETVIDAGCGTGRLTDELLGRLPDGHVIAVDISANMLREAEAHLRPRYGDRVSFRQADLQRLAVDEPVDAIYSTAAFHWVRDHDLLWAGIFKALKPGGWLVAQCGGGPNIERVHARARDLIQREPFHEYFDGWPGPWNFAGDEETGRRLKAAGFVDVETWLEPSLVELSGEAEYRDYLRTVVFGAHLDRLPDDRLRDLFIETFVEPAARDDPPYSLDYWRLNIVARRAE